MFEQIIRWSIAQRWWVMAATVIAALIGVYHYQHLPIDAVPDITNVQVQINTKATGYSPLETEQRVTYPIETVMAGLPNLVQTRSLSRYGLSQVTVIFKDGTDIYFARQLVNERIQAAKDHLPVGITPMMGPTSTGLGEIYLWTVEAEEGAKKADGQPYTPTDLREIQDWIIKPQLRNVTGVTEINSIGGYTKEYHVTPYPDRLLSLGVTLADILTAIDRNNSNVGAGYIEKRGEQYLIRAPGQVKTPEEIGQIVLTSVSGVPIRIQDVADVGLGRELRTGAATNNGREVVLGTVFMLIGQNSREVSQAVDRKMTEINRTLPTEVKVVTVYDRTVLVDKAIATVKTNLLEGALLVIVILFVFLGNLRAALITAMVIPLSMLLTFSGMVTYHVSANLMSLGALDFGIIIDGAVVIVESCVRRLSHAQHAIQQQHRRNLTTEERLHEVFLASAESRRALLFGQMIIMVVYLPIFALTGIEGKLFHPMAATVVMALVAAMVLSVTFIPAAVALLMHRPVRETEPVLMGRIQAVYAHLLHRVMALGGMQQVTLMGGLVLLMVGCGLLASRLGSEFAPNLSEGDFALQALRIPGTSLTQSLAMQQHLERELKAKIPEIKRVFSTTGTADIASDPMPPSVSDGYVMLKPKDQWPNPNKKREEVLAEIQAVAESIPGNQYEFSQPIQLRFNELLSGVPSDVAVKVFGDDMTVLQQSAQQIATALQGLKGAEDVKVEQTDGLPMLTVAIDRQRAARFGLNIADIQDTIAIAMGGREAGVVFEGDRRFDIVVRLPETWRNDWAAMQQLPIALPSSAGDSTQAAHMPPTTPRTRFIPLSEVARFEVAPSPNQISRENGKRRIVVSANVRGRDVGSFVTEAQNAVAKLTIPAGYWVSWGGAFENLQSAMQRLYIVVPLALVLVFGLLMAMFGNLKDSALVFTGIPFALTGGVVALWLRDIPLSMSAAVGFIALSGVAVLNGLVMLSTIRRLQDEGQSLRTAVEEGALSRLRPVLMTALVASLGFIPMAIATGTGAEVQRPLATVVIGGIVSSTLLTLLLLPMLYRWVHRGDSSQLNYRNQFSTTKPLS
jgi:cobalt-zinc-cadmium resistance protein CzcA